MKVLTVCTDLGLGCTPKVAVNICIGSRDAGIENELFAFRGGERESDLRQHLVPLNIGNLKDFEETLSRFKPDIVHFHDSGRFDEGIFKYYVAAKKHSKVVQTNVFGGYSSRTEDLLAARFFVSNATFVKYVSHGGRTEKSSAVIYNPVLPTERYDRSLKPYKFSGVLRLGRIARPDMSKWDVRFEKLIALLSARRQGRMFEFEIVGAPREVRERLTTRGFPIKFVEKLETEFELAQFYGRIDILVHMSLIGESFGCVFVEAGSFGVPVVTNANKISKTRFWRDNGQIEIVENGETGFICRNVVDMRNAILQLSKNPLDKRALQQRVRSRFDTRIILNRLIKCYVDVLAERRFEINVSSALDAYKAAEKNLYITRHFNLLHKGHYLVELLDANCWNLFQKVRSFKNRFSK